MFLVGELAVFVVEVGGDDGGELGFGVGGVCQEVGFLFLLLVLLLLLLLYMDSLVKGVVERLVVGF